MRSRPFTDRKGAALHKAGCRWTCSRAWAWWKETVLIYWLPQDLFHSEVNVILSGSAEALWPSCFHCTDPFGPILCNNDDAFKK